MPSSLSSSIFTVVALCLIFQQAASRYMGAWGGAGRGGGDFLSGGSGRMGQQHRDGRRHRWALGNVWGRGWLLMNCGGLSSRFAPFQNDMYVQFQFIHTVSSCPNARTLANLPSPPKKRVPIVWKCPFHMPTYGPSAFPFAVCITLRILPE